MSDGPDYLAATLHFAIRGRRFSMMPSGHEDVMRLLRSEIKRAGGQKHWAEMQGVSRPALNKMLRGTRPLGKSIIKALKLRIVYAPDSERTPIRRAAPVPRELRPE